ncbi:DUF1330 domain-containing protein [Thalassovita aquimarina]|uniref:DUF1330 domain-containing protein n=1 Tax=Thalassovita aquimarina TaxID=2785917 RepID=UPI0035675D3E
MTHYVVVQMDPKDPETLQQYYKVGGAAVKKHGGYPIAGGADKTVLEDNGGGIPAHVLLAFPDADAATGWIEDPELAEVHALRRKGAHTTITLLPPM